MPAHRPNWVTIGGSQRGAQKVSGGCPEGIGAFGNAYGTRMGVKGEAYDDEYIPVSDTSGSDEGGNLSGYGGVKIFGARGVCCTGVQLPPPLLSLIHSLPNPPPSSPPLPTQFPGTCSCLGQPKIRTQKPRCAVVRTENPGFSHPLLCASSSSHSFLSSGLPCLLYLPALHC
ncbi:hypothetical protein GQ53DRAFT_343482 [Thozetella sp. PMI_491]|nr:hypothetical protein GQ53DRAFT_343482 [Thozetella sp. PMI_491]